MKAIITIAMLISALFSSTKEKNILKYGIYADASRCIAVETVDKDTERVSVQNSGGMVYAFDTDAGDYETGTEIPIQARWRSAGGFFFVSLCSYSSSIVRAV